MTTGDRARLVLMAAIGWILILWMLGCSPDPFEPEDPRCVVRVVAGYGALVSEEQVYRCPRIEFVNFLWEG